MSQCFRMPKESMVAANELFLAKKFSEACAIYDKILGEDPHNIAALNNKGYSLSKLKDYSGALECYDSALAISPDDKTLLTNKISSLRKMKRYADALEYCNNILDSHPRDNITLYHKERILFSMERYLESAECCDAILDSYQENEEVLFDKACALAKAGRADIVIPILAKCAALNHALKNKMKSHSAFSGISASREFLEIISE